MNEFKEELINAYERHCINYMNEEGRATIDEYIESFIWQLDHTLRYTGEGLDELTELFNTDDIEKIEKEIEKILKEYELTGEV